MSLKYQCKPSGEGYYTLEDGVNVPVRLFLSEKLWEETTEDLYQQVQIAASYPGALEVVITPDAHIGSNVPVGCVIATDGTLLHAPVGFDIGCFTGDTLVPTLDGRSYPIQELAERGEEVFVFAITPSQKITVAKATAKKTRSQAPLVRVVLDNGREIRCTPDHEFLLRDGTYRQAKDLTPETSLMPFYAGLDKDGYVYVQQPYSGRNQRVHWMAARAGLLGEVPRFEGQKTVIHHKDFNPVNNHHPGNLCFMRNRDHRSFHIEHGKGLEHWQSPEFEAARKKALADKAQTPEGHAYYAERGTKNILRYMQERPEHFRQSVAGNGARGKKYLVSYNQSEEARAKSKEIGSRIYTCEVCDAKVKSGLGLSGHRRWKHGFNHTVVSVEPLDEVEDVYCLTVPGYGNFALDAGVFVHNCGILCFKSDVPYTKGLDEKLRRKFSEQVMARIGLGVGERGKISVSHKQFQEIVRRGANALHYQRDDAERDFLPVEDGWEPPERAVDKGIGQLGSLGGGNHFAELQYDQDGHLWVMVHTGSRAFGYQLAKHYMELAREEQRNRKGERSWFEATYFLPDSPHWRGYKNAVAAGGNFAIANRLFLWEQISTAFRRVFGKEPELVYEISHNLAQQETLPDGREAWVHRKGATRAFPAGHPGLKGTKWEQTGHPVLIPGSMGDKSYILMPRPGATRALWSVNHGCGRRMSRGEARQRLTQSGVNKQMKRLNVMVNAGGDVPIDESPDVYKPAEDVIAAVVAADLAEVKTVLSPIASIKGVD